MTAEEKAKKIIQRYRSINFITGKTSKMIASYEDCKQCALIAVDEIIDAIDWHEYEVPNIELEYWFKVKEEIEKL